MKLPIRTWYSVLLECNRSYQGGWWSCWNAGRGAFVEVLGFKYEEPPHIVMRTIWRERNHCNFDGAKRLSVALKLHLLHTMFDWLAALSGHLLSSLNEFLDLCHFD